MKHEAGDAYFAYEAGALTLGTRRVEKVVRLSGDGRLAMARLRDAHTGVDYAQCAAQPSDEFQIEFNGRLLAGSTPGWRAGAVTGAEGAQGELEVVLPLSRDGLAVERHYVLYPETGVIQEWTVYENTSGQDAVIGRPSLFIQRVGHRDRADEDFAYMTGGGNFTGSNQFKFLPIRDGCHKEFDSNGAPEIAEADGHFADKRHQRYMGAGIWHEFFAIRNRAKGCGLFVMFDYQGWWKGQFMSRDGNTSLTGWCELIDHPLKAGERLRVAPMIVGAFQGDWDDMGNAITDYIYRYKWDYTLDKYFARSTIFIWRSAPLRDKVFMMIEAARQVGFERIHVDDFWFDAKGNYNGVFGDDWKHINDYIGKHGMFFRLWMPPWHADRLSQVWLDHPDWMIDFHGNWYNWTIDLSREEAYQWILDMLIQKQKEFGTYELRVDGDPCNLVNDGSFDIEYAGDWNRTFKQSENFYRLCRAFREACPDAGMDGCSSGGHTMSIEASRYVEEQQITDGQCYHYGGYWTTMILPIDKHQGMPISGGGRRRPWTGDPFDPAGWQLFSAPGASMQNPPQAVEPEMVEDYRKLMETYRWLRQAGVYGRWIKVYRPTVEHGDPTFILQRMTKDNLRGVVMISSNPLNPILGRSAVIYPKGLLPDERYLVQGQFEEGFAQASKSGGEWMREGIRLSKVVPGQTLYINLPERPGQGYDDEPPTAPGAPIKRAANWIGRDGVEIEWGASADNVMVSYYEIEKNGKRHSVVSIGTYLFDAGASIADEYRVRAVDGDGNCSDWVDAR
ncbi:MAG: hypothetical protein GX558_03265 [Clostridiales bacterium]|nr:hypothetical protein [Clostridiales bacterium]